MRYRATSIYGSFYRSILLFLIVFTLTRWAGAQNLTINPGLSTLFAGDPTGKNGLSSANYTGLASGLVMKSPGNIVFDSAGNLYEVEWENAIIRVVAGSNNPIPVLPGVAVQAGHVYTVAGTTNGAGTTIPCAGGIDVQGNGCPATEAAVSNVLNIAVDGKGNLYINDTFDTQIRVVYGGTGTLPGVSNPKQGYIYALTNVNNSGANNSPTTPVAATSVTLEAPNAFTVDSNGNIYAFDRGNKWYLWLIYAGGDLPAGFFSGATPTPGDIYMVSNLYSCSEPSPSICNGDPIADANFNNGIDAMATDASGNLYLADDSALEIRAVSVSGSLPGISDPTPGNIYQIAGNGIVGGDINGPALSSTLSFNWQSTALSTDSVGDVYVTNYTNIFTPNNYPTAAKIDTAGNLTIAVGGTAPCGTPTDSLNDGCVATSLLVTNDVFYGVAVDSSGNVYVSNVGGSGIAIPSVIFKSDVSTSALYFPGTIGLPSAAQTLYISNTSKQALQLSNIAFTGPFEQLTGGSNNCTSSTTLATGEICQIQVSFLPTKSGAATGTLTIASNSLNATDGVNTITLAGNAAKASSSVNLAPNPGYPSIANVGQPVTLTATAIPQYQDTLTPTGTVTFMNGSATLGTATIANGVASITSSGFAAGTYAVTAVYSGDTNFVTSTSSPSKVVVSATPVAVVTLTPSATSGTSGQSITLTATAAAFSGSSVPTGTITFQVGGSPLPNGTATLSNGTATLTTTALPVGTDNLVAVYSGDGNFGANVSTPVPVTITSAAQIQLSPGLISRLSGGYFTTATTTPASGSSAASAQYGQYTREVAVDSNGNAYVATDYNYTNQLMVTYSGKGAIPGVSNPVAGSIYVIGSGTPCSSSAPKPCGDGGPISAASFTTVGSIAVDALNNIYVADNGVIRKISAATGIINTVAGTWGTGGYAAFSGNNGPATSAVFVPSSLSVDPNGNIYIADNNNLLIYKVNGQTDIITVVAGTPTQAGQSIGANACTTLPCGDGGLATSAALNGPEAIFVDQADNFYIADNGGYSSTVHGATQMVRKVDAQSGVISLYAGQYEEGTGLVNCGPSAGYSCGDGGPATQAIFESITGVSGDQAGDIYIADDNLSTIREVNGQTGVIQTVVGTANGEGSQTNQCTTSLVPCGDGGPATSAELKQPYGVTLDPQGNIYVIDGGANVLREVTGATTALAYGSQDLGTTVPETVTAADPGPQTVTVTNTGLQPLVFSNLTIPFNYLQQASGGTDCTASITLAPGAACELDIAFFPTVTGALPATLTIASNAGNATNGQNTISLTGTGVTAGGSGAQTITFNAPAGPFYAGEQVSLSATATSGLAVEYLVTSGSGIILNNGSASPALKITGAGNLTITAYQFGNGQYAPATPVSVNLTATQPVLTITASVPSLMVGTPLPAYTSSADYKVSGLIPGDTTSVVTGQPAIIVQDASGATIPVGTVLATGTYTVVISQGTLSFPSYYKPAFVNGTLNVTGTNLQTISFPALPSNTTYTGSVNYTLNAVADDGITGKPNGLPITYSATGPATIAGNILTVSGAGTVNVTATQVGNSVYASASASQTIQVAKATLTVTAVSLTYAQGVPLPALTSSSNYTITGLVPGDTLTAVTGEPSLSVVDTKGLTGNPGAVLAVGATPPPGVYAIDISAGFLAAANYNFNFVNGTLTVNTGTAQSISFPAIPSVTYGAAPISLGATATSGLAVSYAVSPSNIATLSGNIITITGAGVVTVTATQTGNSTYAPATPAQQTFTVNPAVLAVTANNATRVDNTPNPTFSYTITGFVNGDTQGAAVSGSVGLLTTATTSSPIGQYPITFNTNTNPNNPGADTLSASNYIFNLVPGVLTITTGGPVAGYTLTATPQSISILQVQIGQVQITLSPVNYYQGLVSFSCGTLPANVTCTFSPATLAPDGTNNPISTTLTINTNSANPVVGLVRSQSGGDILRAACFWLPSGICGLLILLGRRRIGRKWGTYGLLLLLALQVGLTGMAACGGSNSATGSTVAQPGNSTITVTAAASGTTSTSQSIPIAITVK